MLNIEGSYHNRGDKEIRESYEDAYASTKKWAEENDWDGGMMESFDDFVRYNEETIKDYPELDVRSKKIIRGTAEKEFTIIELHKRFAICAWRNGERATAGMTFRCPIKRHNGHICLFYKDKPYRLDKGGGWVI